MTITLLLELSHLTFTKLRLTLQESSGAIAKDVIDNHDGKLMEGVIFGMANCKLKTLAARNKMRTTLQYKRNLELLSILK